MTQTIAGVTIPDSRLVAEATELVRDSAPPLLFHHSRRVFRSGCCRATSTWAQPRSAR
ncbi:MAG TPA: hypothetical protein VK735_38470 [Pseudonocardia sp.]|uniref:hypothetical protein n=1 Tax=Pseudonocardia sp. TaxID=60912 RepID=UPI002C17E38E|nr:hypothetical protein [Pseudonocardia sp.]HTF53367.1 hypothetical protein [Pseudonocardia sp.]